jgi:glucokinase
MSALFASIDLGGTNIHAAVATAAGEIIADLKEPTHSHEGPEGVIARMKQLLVKLGATTNRRPQGMGVGAPGLVDFASGTTRFFPNFPTQWRDVPLGARLAEFIGAPVWVLNDARTAALGELVYGHGKAAKTFLFYTLGTGVGGAVVIEGRIRLGEFSAAGEIGHVTIDPHGLPCGCGSRGCLETLASGPAITGEAVRLVLAGNAPMLRELSGGDLNLVSPQLVAEAVQRGEAASTTLLGRVGEALGIGAASLVSALHPPLVVLAGGIAQLGDAIIEPMRRSMVARVGMFPADAVRIVRSELGDRAGLMGGIALAVRGGNPEKNLSL